MAENRTTASQQFLDAWRSARDAADRLHREALAEADKLYEHWLAAQRNEATRGAALDTASWQDRLAAMQVLADASVRMRKPGDWYVQQGISVSNGVILSGYYGNGSTPEAAVEDHWRIYTRLDEGTWIAVKDGDDRMNAVWDGDAWKTWKPEPAVVA